MNRAALARLVSMGILTIVVLGCGSSAHDPSVPSQRQAGALPEVTLAVKVGESDDELRGPMLYRVDEGAPLSSLTLMVRSAAKALQFESAVSGTDLTDGMDTTFVFKRGESQGALFDVAADQTLSNSISFTAGTITLACDGPRCSGTVDLSLEDGRAVKGDVNGEVRFQCSSFDAQMRNHGTSGSPLAPNVPVASIDSDLTTAFCSKFQHMLR